MEGRGREFEACIAFGNEDERAIADLCGTVILVKCAVRDIGDLEV